MGLLTRPEINALVAWAKDFQQAQMDGFLWQSAATHLDNIVPLPALRPVWAVAVAQWIDGLKDAVRIRAILTDAVAERPPPHPSAAVLQAAIARLATVVERAALAGPPHEARLIDGVPVVNRTHLRAYLEQLTRGVDLPIVVVQGERGLGRTHSWHLIDHVATKSGIADFRKIDMVEPILAQQTVKDIFDLMVRRLNLPAGSPVSTDGVTPTTLGARYAAEFVQRLSDAMNNRPTPFWIALDSVDRPLEEALRSFIRELASAAAARELSGCTLFLLGPDRSFSPQDQYALIRRESLTQFLDAEIDDACTRLNDLGTTKLSSADLATFRSELRQQVQGLGGSELCKVVVAQLVRLRDTVNA